MIQGISRVFQGSFRGCFKNVSRVFYVSLQLALKSFKGFSNKFPISFKEVPRVIQGRLKSASKGVFRGLEDI